ncbi:MAG: VWA domain-containing protein [Bacteroidia bacterium]|nr:VWA domain-containing protein [Bacteroidia bacterium]
MVRILWLIGLFFLYPAWAFAQDTELPESSLFPSVSAVITEEFPTITLVLNNTQPYKLQLDRFSVKENDQPAKIISFSDGRANHSLKTGLVFDHGLSVNQDSLVFLDYAKSAAAEFLLSWESTRDSFVLVSFAGGVDNTDFNNNTEVFSLILNSLEPDSGRRIFDAMQVGLEALLPHRGRRILVVFVAGRDGGSDTPVKTVLQTARHLRIPIYIIAAGAVDRPVLELLTSRTGGALVYADSAEKLPLAFKEISRQLLAVSELRYLSNISDEKPPFKRSIELTSIISPDFPPQTIKTTYRIDRLPVQVSSVDIARHRGKNQWGMVLAILISIGIVVGFIVWRKNRIPSDLVVPAITEITFYKKNTRIRVEVNIPLRSRPAKFTIYTQAGVPVMDAVYPGRKRQYDVDISELPFGVYYCTLTNGGLTSERKDMVRQVV